MTYLLFILTNFLHVLFFKKKKPEKIRQPKRVEGKSLSFHCPERLDNQKILWGRYLCALASNTIGKKYGVDPHV